MTVEQIKAEAWVGDAVLTLYARERILRQSGRVDGEQYGRLTSNQFLSALGEPTEVEARLGRVYRNHGLDAAFAWIEQNVLPLFLRQEEKRARKESGPHKAARRASMERLAEGLGVGPGEGTDSA